MYLKLKSIQTFLLIIVNNNKRNDNEKLKFFYLGKKNNWKNLLNPDIERKIRTSFSAEMKELNYV